jgi:histidinol-phosphate/aromatic aminotransferase/cobyric acid decarboxylase-like protein
MSQGAHHGGAFFDAIGVDFRTLQRRSSVISADVLDAWFDPSPRVLTTLREYLPFLIKTSPPIYAEGLVAAIAEARGIPRDFILCGGGSTALIFGCLPRLVMVGAGVMMLDPSYGEYHYLCENVLHAGILLHRLQAASGYLIDTAALIEDTSLFDPDVIIIVNPNSPTGVLWPREQFLEWMRRVPASTLVWVDETYIDYAGPEHSLERDVADFPNLVVLKSMSKVYALSGLRVGYLVAQPPILARLTPYEPPWAVSLPAQVAAVEALGDPDYYIEHWNETRRLREDVVSQLKGVTVYPSDANYYLIEPEDAPALAARLREKDIFVREFSGQGYLRVAVKDAQQNARIIASI